ncbi:17448_t:CDS:1, partial [Racocetra persica]
LQLTQPEIENDALNRLKTILLKQNKSLKDFPNMLCPESVCEFGNTLLNDELNYDIPTLTDFIEQNIC